MINHEKYYCCWSNQEEDGGFIAEGLTENIFTQADTWAELKENVIEAVKGYYFDQPLAPNIKLHSKELYSEP